MMPWFGGLSSSSFSRSKHFCEKRNPVMHTSCFPANDISSHTSRWKQRQLHPEKITWLETEKIRVNDWLLLVSQIFLSFSLSTIKPCVSAAAFEERLMRICLAVLERKRETRKLHFWRRNKQTHRSKLFLSRQTEKERDPNYLNGVNSLPLRWFARVKMGH